MSRLNDLIRQLRLKDPALADDLAREVEALADRRAFGLNFERHVPEAVELPGRRVRRGDKVRVLPPRGTVGASDETLWRVVTIDRTATPPVATLDAVHITPGADVESRTAAVPDLVVVAEFRDPVYPGLVSTSRVECGGNTPFHTVINAENFHALQALLFSHRGQVDLIYIDPPYNTGTADWIYNDKYVSADDLYRHSKWLAFMERRLLLARELLKDTGVIIVAIGDDEHHRLRMLLDQVFGDANFLSDVVWQGGRKNDSRYVSNAADYMLIYAYSEAALSSTQRRWFDRKPGVDKALAAAQQAWADSGQNENDATKIYRSWLRRNKSSLADGVSRYNAIDAQGRVYFAGDLSSPNPRANLQYEVFHPTTTLPVKMNANGWRASSETMDRMIAEGRVLFGADHTTTAYYKRFLSEQTDETVSSVFERDRRASRAHLKNVLGEARFPNPKDCDVLRRWIGLAASRDALVLDFFGGSGATTEAVMRLNAEDGGTRQSILVTNNELDAKVARELAKDGRRSGDAEWEARGVHEYVTRPRLTTVVTGKRADGSTYDDPVAANVEFFDLTYEAPLRVASNREFARVAPLLWLRAGARGRRIDDVAKGWDVADAYGVIADFDHTDVFLAELADRPDVRLAFVVTDEDRLFESMCRDLPEYVEPVRLYQAYLRNFELRSGRGAR